MKCGDLKEGFARIRCRDCGTERFLPFSCRQRGACPSCDRKRSLALGIRLNAQVSEAVPHRQWVLANGHPVQRFHAIYDLHPDGTRLALAGQIDTTTSHREGCSGDQGQTVLLTVNVDGSNLRMLQQPSQFSHVHPCWLSNGKIAYASNCAMWNGRCHVRGDRCGGYGTALWSMKEDGSDAYPISWHKTANSIRLLTMTAGLCTPDGTTLIETGMPRTIQIVPATFGGIPTASTYGASSVCMALGTVPVESDGSAYFEAPVGKSIYFQALDENDMATSGWRSRSISAMIFIVPPQSGHLSGSTSCTNLISDAQTNRACSCFVSTSAWAWEPALPSAPSRAPLATCICQLLTAGRSMYGSTAHRHRRCVTTARHQSTPTGMDGARKGMIQVAPRRHC